MAQKRKMDYNYLRKGERRSLTRQYIDKPKDGNFP
jgi:hypothetical protein